MRNKIIILIIAGFLVTLSSCIEDLFFIDGNGITATDTRRSAGFFKLENSTSIDVVYKHADTSGVTIEADENLLDYIVTETNNNTLVIKYKDNNSRLDFKSRPLITVTSTRLESVTISGSGAFIADEMEGDAIILKLSGSADISVAKAKSADLMIMLSGSGNMNVNNSQNESADIFLVGSGSINLSGKSTDCNIKITGSGEIFAENFLLDSASIIISGSGNSYTNIKTSLTGIISGSGNIYLKGNPAISQTISGSGRIIKYK